MLEVSFSDVPPDWAETLNGLPEVADVKAEDNVFRISSNNGPRTTVALMEAAREAGVDGDFAFRAKHDAGRRFRALHRASVARRVAGAVGAQQPVHHEARLEPCIAFWAIIERDLRRFRRSPTLMIVSMVMPLVQLVVLGYAFGGKVKNLEVGVVDQDHGVPAVKLKEMFQAVAANASTFDTDLLHRPGGGAAGFAQRQNQRRAEHPAGIFAQSAGRGQSAASR